MSPITCTITRHGDVHVVAVAGELDANTSPVAQQEIMPLAERGAKILIDLSGVSFMSSAGLRLLLSTYRKVNGLGGAVALAGLSDELKDTMSMTGFLSFFVIHDTAGLGVEALQAGS